MRRLPGAALHALGGAAPAPPGLLLPLLFLPSFSPDNGHMRKPLLLIGSLLSETHAFPRASRLFPCCFCSRFSASSELGSEAFGVACLACGPPAASPLTSSCAACLAASLRALSPCGSSPSLLRPAVSFRPEETRCYSSVSSRGHWQPRSETQVSTASFASLRRIARGGQRILARRRPASELCRGGLRGRSTTFTGLSPGERVGGAREKTKETCAKSRDSLDQASPRSWASRQPQQPLASRLSNMLAASGCLFSSASPLSFSSPSSLSSPPFICSPSRVCSSERDPSFQRAGLETSACSPHRKRCGRSGDMARRQERRFCRFRPGDTRGLGRTSLAACDSGGFKAVSPQAGAETDESDSCAKESREGKAIHLQRASRAEAEEPSEAGGKPRGATVSTSLQRLYRHDGWPEEGELVNGQGLALRTYTWWPCQCNPCLASLGRASSKYTDASLRLEDPASLPSSFLSSSCSSVSPPSSSSASSILGKLPTARWWLRGSESAAAAGPVPSREEEGQANTEETVQRSSAEKKREGNGDWWCLVGEKGELQRDRKTGRTACAACNKPIRGVVILVHGYGEHCRSHFLQKLQERPRASSAPTETTEEEGRRGVGGDPVEAERDADFNRASDKRSSLPDSPPATASVSSDSSVSSSSFSSRASSLDLSDASSDLPSVFAPGPESSLGSLFYEGSWVHALNARGFLVVGFDLQGHGLSGAWRGLRCVVSELDDFARDALLVVLSTQRRFGRPDRDAFPFHLLGISMGGWTAARAVELAGHSETLCRCWAHVCATPETPHKRARETGEEDSEGRGATPAAMRGEEKAGGEELDRCGRSALLGAAGREGERKTRKERESGEDKDEQQLASKKTPRANLSPGSHQIPSEVANLALGLTGLILVSPMFDLERRKAKLKWELAKYGILPLAAFFPGVPLELFAPWRRLKSDRKRKRVAEYEKLRLSFQADPLTFKASPPGGLVAAIMRGAQRALEPEEVDKINCENVERVLILHNATDSICDAGGAVQFFQRLGSGEKEEAQTSGEEETRECGEAERFRQGDLDAVRRPAKRRGQKAPEKALILLNVGAAERSSGKREDNLTEQQRSFAAFVERERARAALENSQSGEDAALSKAAGGGQAGGNRGANALCESAEDAEVRGTRGKGQKVRRSGAEAERDSTEQVEKARKKEKVSFVENVDVWHNLANEPGQEKVFELLDAWLEGDTQRKECAARKEQTEPAERGRRPEE
ncbi:alpha/beta hydrolase family protein [Toxoplasma gondii TgCatPRC2]|uniref:Alpha/beta hydrolase family protein n=1 Tax=Toxoplasma gondii TgCatPRC2 TaxID=1130821 RepID=A0A151H0Q5_TOXGO|nr:alpha/beta hydrolase family protein [Toxoplasma gondii TgCatPRC2]